MKISGPRCAAYRKVIRLPSRNKRADKLNFSVTCGQGHRHTDKASFLLKHLAHRRVEKYLTKYTIILSCEICLLTIHKREEQESRFPLRNADYGAVQQWHQVRVCELAVCSDFRERQLSLLVHLHVEREDVYHTPFEAGRLGRFGAEADLTRINCCAHSLRRSTSFSCR